MSAPANYNTNANNQNAEADVEQAIPSTESPSILKQQYQQAAENLQKLAGNEPHPQGHKDGPHIIKTEGDETLEAAAQAHTLEIDQAMATAMEDLIAERDQLKDQVLRVSAEMDNLRKRTEKEKLNSAQYAITSFAKDLLTLADAFTEGQKALPEEAEADKNPVVAGFKMTHKELLRVFQKHGLQHVEALDQPFDPDKHQAITQLPVTEGKEAGTVAQVMQEGFMLNGRLLRPALVAVYQ